MQIQELKIRVPWGHIAVKAWGNEANPLILVAHGWTDNAGSFDRLIPLLPTSYYYYCFDLPGHGKSSHLEASLLLFVSEYIVVFKLLCDYLNRGKIIIMGHSMGGYLVTHFTQMYPECVSRLIVIETLYYFPRSAASFYNHFKQTMNARVKMLKREKPDVSTLTKQEAVRRIHHGRMTPINRETAEILVERNLEEVEDGKYRFTIAPQVKNMVHGYFTLRDIEEVTKRFPIKCPHLVIMAEDSSMTWIAYRNVEKEYKKNRHYQFHIVKGNHECHLSYPEEVAPVITNFLNTHQSKL